MTRWRQVWDAIWPALMFILFFAVLMVVAEAPTPDQWHVDTPQPTAAEIAKAEAGYYADQTGWEDIVIFALAFTFLAVKSTVMIERMGRPIDWLTITLVAANLGFMTLYALVTAQIFFAHWFMTHPSEADWIVRLARWGLIITLAWGTVVIVMTPPGQGYYVKRKEHEGWTGGRPAIRPTRRLRRRFRAIRRSRSAVKRGRSTRQRDRTPV